MGWPLQRRGRENRRRNTCALRTQRPGRGWRQPTTAHRRRPNWGEPPQRNNGPDTRARSVAESFARQRTGTRPVTQNKRTRTYSDGGNHHLILETGKDDCRCDDTIRHKTQQLILMCEMPKTQRLTRKSNSTLKYKTIVTGIQKRWDTFNFNIQNQILLTTTTKYHLFALKQVLFYFFLVGRQKKNPASVPEAVTEQPRHSHPRRRSGRIPPPHACRGTKPAAYAKQNRTMTTHPARRQHDESGRQIASATHDNNTVPRKSSP